MSEQFGFEDLAAAGWREEDILWETTAAEGMQRLAIDDPASVREAFAATVRLAQAAFSSNDPRLGASLANLGAALVAAGESGRAERTIADARAIWRDCDAWVVKMTAPRVAKSSLFHMRMEQRHRPAYEARWRVKWAELVEDGRRRVAPEPLRLVSAEAAAGRLALWRRERPAMLNDTRKLMAAALLLACDDGPNIGD